MATQKIIIIVAFILTLTFSGVQLAGAVSGVDWYSMEPPVTVGQEADVVSSGSAVARSGIGTDWYDTGDIQFVKHNSNDRSLAIGKISGIGMDWYTGKSTTLSGSKEDCRSLAVNDETGKNNC